MEWLLALWRLGSHRLRLLGCLLCPVQLRDDLARLTTPHRPPRPSLSPRRSASSRCLRWSWLPGRGCWTCWASPPARGWASSFNHSPYPSGFRPAAKPLCWSLALQGLAVRPAAPAPCADFPSLPFCVERASERVPPTPARRPPPPTAPRHPAEPPPCPHSHWLAHISDFILHVSLWPGRCRSGRPTLFVRWVNTGGGRPRRV